MTSDPFEALWSQAVDDGDYAAAEAITEQRADDESHDEAKKLTNEQTMVTGRLATQRAYIAVYLDPTSPLYRPLPRDMDCIDKRNFGSTH